MAGKPIGEAALHDRRGRADRQCAIGDSHAGRQKNKGHRAGKSNFLNHHRHT
jgi:hypothetical protein